MNAVTQPGAAPFEAVAEVVERRLRTYRLLRALLEAPTPALAARLGDGSLAAELRSAVAWFGAEARWFDRAAAALDGSEVPVPPFAALAEEHHRLLDPTAGEAGDGTVVTGELDALVAMAESEAAAWRSGDAADGATARQRTQARLGRGLAAWADELAAEVAARAVYAIYPAAAEALCRFVDLELARGFDASQLPWRDRRAPEG